MTTRRNVLALTALGLLTACTRTPETAPTPTSTDPAHNLHLADQIATRLATLPGVTDSEVVYTPATITSSAGIRGTFTTTTRAQAQALLDEFRRQVWTSQINPLAGIDGVVGYPGDAVSISEIYRDVAPTMTARYGPRPVPLLDR